MRLAAQPKRIVAADIEHLAIDRVVAIGLRVAHQRLRGDGVQVGAFDRRRGAGEIFVDKRTFETHRIEDLRPAIGLVGRDAHLGHDLEEALADRLQIVLLHVVGAEREPCLGADLLQRREGEIGVDRLRAVAGEHTEIMHLTGVAGLDDNAGAGAQPLADQMVVHRRGREQRRDRRALRRHRAVGKDEDVVPREHRLGRRVADRLERRLQRVRADAAGQVMSSVSVLNLPSTSRSILRILSRSLSVRIGCDTSSR